MTSGSTNDLSGRVVLSIETQKIKQEKCRSEPFKARIMWRGGIFSKCVEFYLLNKYEYNSYYSFE